MYLRRLLRKNRGFEFWSGLARVFQVGKRDEATADDWNWRIAGNTLRLHSRRSNQRALVATGGRGTTGALFPRSNVPRHVTAAAHASALVQSTYEKNQLGLSQFFLNSLRLTWVVGLLADTIALLRALAITSEPKSSTLLHQIIPRQTHFDLE